MSLPGVAAVVDTNVLVSGLIGKYGAPAAVLKAFQAGHFTLVTSEPLLNELEVVTLRPKITERFDDQDLVNLWLMLREGAEVVTPLSREPVIGDPADNILFTTAMAGKAQCIVTGDKLLLALVRVEGIRVVSPRDFLSLLDK